MLAPLLLQRARPISPDAPVDRLWPDEPPLTATKTVQVYIGSGSSDRAAMLLDDALSR